MIWCIDFVKINLILLGSELNYYYQPKYDVLFLKTSKPSRSASSRAITKTESNIIFFSGNKEMNTNCF